MEESVWSFDVVELGDIPDAVGNGLRELERQGVHVVEGPTIERVQTPAGDRWSVTFVVEGPVES
jgi:hypothetical protein